MKWPLNIFLVYLVAANLGCQSSGERAASVREQDNAEMQMLFGQHFDENLAKAQNGNAVAQYTVGNAYWLGVGGVAKNPIAAANWLRKAAEQNHSGAQQLLGFFLANGVGVPQDYVEAYKWEYLSYEQGDSYANEAVRYLNSIARNMTPSQINEAKQLAREFKTQK